MAFAFFLTCDTAMTPVSAYPVLSLERSSYHTLKITHGHLGGAFPCRATFLTAATYLLAVWTVLFGFFYLPFLIHASFRAHNLLPSRV